MSKGILLGENMNNSGKVIDYYGFIDYEAVRDSHTRRKKQEAEAEGRPLLNKDRPALLAEVITMACDRKRESLEKKYNEVVRQIGEEAYKQYAEHRDKKNEEKQLSQEVEQLQSDLEKIERLSQQNSGQNKQITDQIESIKTTLEKGLLEKQQKLENLTGSITELEQSLAQYTYNEEDAAEVYETKKDLETLDRAEEILKNPETKNLYRKYMSKHALSESLSSVTAEYLKNGAKLSKSLDKLKSSIEKAYKGPDNIFSQIIDIIIGSIKRLFHKQDQKEYRDQVQNNIEALSTQFKELPDKVADTTGYRESLQRCVDELTKLHESLQNSDGSIKEYNKVSRAEECVLKAQKIPEPAKLSASEEVRNKIPKLEEQLSKMANEIKNASESITNTENVGNSQVQQRPDGNARSTEGKAQASGIGK